MNATIYYKNIFGDNKMTKYKILEILRENKDSFVSGEILSRKLNVSRTAVWKGIKSLKEKGYLIEGINNKGYRLTGDNKNILSDRKSVV